METSNQNPYGSLVASVHTKELKSAKGILLFVGIMTILFQSFLLFNARDELNKVYEEQLGKQGLSLSAVKDLPPEVRAEFEKASGQDLRKVRMIYAVGVALGITFILCGAFVYAKPVLCTVTGLTLYLGANAAMAALEPMTLVQGIILKIVIIVALISAVKAALASESARRAAPPA